MTTHQQFPGIQPADFARMQEAFEKPEVTCNYIMTGDGQFLTDHHNRENELLICTSPTANKEYLLEYLVGSAFDSEKIPNFLSDKDVIDAIKYMINQMTDEDCYPSYYENELEKTDEDGFYIDCGINIYAYLAW